MHRGSVTGLAASAVTGNATDADLQTLDPALTAASPDDTPVAGRKDIDPPTLSTLGPSEFIYQSEDERENNLLTKTRMRYFCTAKWFLVVLCIFVLFQSLIVSGLSAGTVSSIQTRYHIDSTMMGLINAFYDLVVSFAVPLLSYYGGHGHTPRFLGVGMFLVGLGSIITAFPQFIDGKYDLQDDRTLICTSSTLTQNCVGSNDAVIAVLYIGQFFTAVGAAGLYTLGPAYLDKIFTRQQYPMAVGIFYAIAALGPALGFIVSGSFLKQWVDLGDPPVTDLKPEDPEWIGAWWLPYLFIGIICSALSSLLFLFPQYVPDTKHIRTDNKRHARELERRLLRLQTEQFGADDESARAMEEHLNRRHDWKAQTWSMLRNKAYIFNNLGQAFDGFTVAALATFMPKIAQSLFNLTASNASFTVGLVSIPGAVGGTITSGLLLKRFKVSPKNQGKVLILVQVIAIFFCTFVALGCPTAGIVGVNRHWANESGFSIDNSCNTNCHCNPDKYNPICGSDGRTYFSACFAGCLNRTVDEQNYGNCGCMGDVLKQAKKNKCSEDCSNFGPFLVLLFLAMFFTFMAVVPAVNVLIRSLPFQERPLGLAYQNATYRWLGPIPAPPIMGAAIDKACFLFAYSCGKELGDCLEYDSVELRRNIAALVFVPKGIAICCYITSLYFFNRVYPDENDVQDLTDVPSPVMAPSPSPSTDSMPRPLVAPAL